MRMLYVEVLKYLERKGAVVFLGRYGVEDLLEGVDDIRDDKLVLFVDCITILLVFLTEDPAIDSLRYRYLLLLEQPQQCLHQHLTIVFG